MKLLSLLKDIPIEYKIIGSSDADIKNICYDSRKATEGSLLVCLVGVKSDGHDYIMSAYEAGCRVFATEREIALPEDATLVLFKNTRQALAYLSMSFFGHPAREMKIVGITGTKGKTSVASMLKSCLEKVGIPAGYIGTSGIDYNGKHFDTKNTTPESYELHRTFREMLDDGIKVAVIEVSSQALFNYRVEGIRFFCAVYTNLSPDHIGPGEHPNFEHYKSCKKRLFSLCENAVFNRDDEYYPDMSQGVTCNRVTYGTHSTADFSRNIRPATRGKRLSVDFTLSSNGEDIPVSLGVPGEFSVMNALCVLAVADLFGASACDVAQKLYCVTIPGRFETVELFDDRSFIIDYAHNEISMRTLLETVRQYSPKRIICLYGSVGERTKNRRRELALVAREMADFSVITADNPGCEDPRAIAEEIASYYENDNFVIIPDRIDAIKYAVESSRPGDVVLLCGKGHENYQLIGKEKVPFCERDILLELVK